jgi:hypothetical protein
MAHARLQSAIAKGVLEARRVVLIGSAVDCARFATRLAGTGIRLVGSFHFPMESSGSTPAAARAHAARSLIDDRRVRPDDVLILTNHDTMIRTPGLVAPLSELPAGLHIALLEPADLLSAARIVEFGHMVTLQVSQPPLSTFDQAAKRVFDIVVAGAPLFILSPLMLLVSIAIKLDSHGPVFFVRSGMATTMRR